MTRVLLYGGVRSAISQQQLCFLLLLNIALLLWLLQLLVTYLAFCGMAISNALAIEAYTREYDRNKVSYCKKSPVTMSMTWPEFLVNVT